MNDIKIFVRKKKKKSGNMVVNVTKISQKMKKISWLVVEKNIIKWEKALYYNYKKVLFQKNNDLKTSFNEKYKNVLKNQFWSYEFTSER